jgi:hypothetical protein
VLAKPLAALDAAPGNPWDDATGAAFPAAAAIIVGLVGVQLGRPAAGPSPPSNPNTRHSIQGGDQHTAVMAVGTAERQVQRRAAGVRDKVALGAGLTAVRRIGADLRAPLLAPMLALSSAARDQSMASAA